MKKILVITPRFPYPVIGGDRLRIYEICKELSKNHSVTLASLCETEDEMSYTLPNDGVFNSVHRCYLPKWKSYINTLLALPSKTPLQVGYYRSTQFKKMVGKLAGEHDLIIPHLIRVADYVKDIHVPKVIEMTDAISMNYARISQIKNNAGIRGLIYKVEKKRLNRYEKDIAKYFDYSVFVSQYDKDFLFKDDDDLYRRSLVCSNGVDLGKLPYQFKSGIHKLIFIGNMQSAQNYDAAYWFAKNVLPELLKLGPYEFYVIGRIPQESANKLASFRGVVVTGAVESVAKYASGALAGICCVRLAAGVQNKILEYMALGAPVLTTSIGLEGLAAKDGEQVLVANTVEEYLNHITSLQSDSDYAKKISEGGYVYVKENHSWSGKLRPLCQVVNHLLNK